MLAISIVLFVVPDNSYLVMFQHYFTYRISLFRNQNLNIQKKEAIHKYRLNLIPTNFLNNLQHLNTESYPSLYFLHDKSHTFR